MKRKLEAGTYGTPVEFCDDVRLIFANSRLYNRVPKSQVRTDFGGHQMLLIDIIELLDCSLD